MRKLATIAKVGEIKPIDGADKIELAVLDGRAWQCVVGKNEFKKGDMGVYFEVDSFLPKQPPFTFLEGRCNKKMGDVEGYRLKTMKLRGQISQGLFMPLEKFSNDLYPDFNDFINDGFASIGDIIGSDVTKLLGVELYEAPIPASLAGEVKGAFPSFLSKTDQERLENVMEYFETMKGVEFECTVKMDGSSCTAYYSADCEDAFGVCSRNLNLKETEKNTFWKVAREKMLEERLGEYYNDHNRNLAIQGELVGDGIQKNRSKIKGHDIFVFDIFDIDKHAYLMPDERMKVLEELNKGFDIKLNHVPVIGIKKVFDEFKTFDELHDWVSSQRGYNDTTIEGVVFKSCGLVNGRNITFKLINRKYLLKHGE